MATVADCITDALSRINVLEADEIPSSADMAKGFAILTSLTDTWGADRMTIPYILRTTATLTASTASFTVGTGGDINIIRPVFFSGISFIDTSQDPDLEIPLRRLTDDEWRLTALKALTSTMPVAAYYNPTYASGFGTLYPWPIPTSSTLQWAVYAPVALPDFAATSTTLVVPPGYYEFIVTNLAFKLCGVFSAPKSIRDQIQQEKNEATAIVKRANFRISELGMPAGLPGTGRGYNYLDFLTGY